MKLIIGIAIGLTLGLIASSYGQISGVNVPGHFVIDQQPFVANGIRPMCQPGITEQCTVEGPQQASNDLGPALMPGGVSPDGRVRYLKLDKDGNVLASCQ